MDIFQNRPPAICSTFAATIIWGVLPRVACFPRRAALEVGRLIWYAAPRLRVKPLAIFRNRLAMVEYVRDRAHQHTHHRFIERRELVVHPQSVFPRHHQILPA
jgi:hypothetical protein